jgi:hypothetical protein
LYVSQEVKPYETKGWIDLESNLSPVNWNMKRRQLMEKNNGPLELIGKVKH